MFTKSRQQVLKELSVNEGYGLRADEIAPRRAKYGANVMQRSKRKSLIMRVLEGFCEPMLLILCFALIVTFGINLGKYIKTGDGDFVECAGIFIAVVVSVTITVVMEGRSEKAFEMLSGMADKVIIKVRRDGQIRLIPQSEIVVGDIVIMESGDKVVADGRIIKSENLSADESMLTGESRPRSKRADAYIKENAPLSDRINMVYGGTLIVSGNGEMVVTAVGSNAEIGKIASELQIKSKVSSPLNEKLARLGKWVTVIGGVCAAIVFVVSVARLIISDSATFENMQEIFIESVVLIVAAVPEGLPTIVAISLSVNVMKLAKENALIKKLVATETAGCVSVICSDKTGTLTQNKMAVEVICSGACFAESRKIPLVILENICVNSTAEGVFTGGVATFEGNPTERALLEFAYGKNARAAMDDRAMFHVVDREEFTSEKKYMSTKTRKNGVERTYYKGSYEKIFGLCKITGNKADEIVEKINRYSSKARRILAFAHSDGGEIVFDGFAALTDPVRKDVKQSVDMCRKAGIDVKILTGDNEQTAFAVAIEVGIAKTRKQVVSAADIEGISDDALKRLLPTISVIARSTPLIKLRVVKLLKELGEVVAVTGDGINDAPAIRQADIGIAMGSGSEIAKEAGDIVLIDDSFTTIVKAISFGRNVFINFQRFIMFQLSVNFSAVMIVLAALFIGAKSPFNALQLLWINIIMDGPPALTLGFEKPSKDLMSSKPKKRTGNLVTKKVAGRLFCHSAYMAMVLTMQMQFNFLHIPLEQQPTAIFTAFVLFQLFNAFNCRQVGSKSIFKDFFSNKAMLIAFGLVLFGQIIITQFCGGVFGTVPLQAQTWIKLTCLSATVLLISELSKLIYRIYQRLSGVNRERNNVFLPTKG